MKPNFWTKLRWFWYDFREVAPWLASAGVILLFIVVVVSQLDRL